MFASLCFDDTKHVFSVIHFELLRQYLRMEFAELQTQIQFDFNMDNIVDDWTVLMTLFGNDYVPGLPNFEMSADVLSVIYDAYKQVLKVSKGECSSDPRFLCAFKTGSIGNSITKIERKSISFRRLHKRAWPLKHPPVCPIASNVEGKWVRFVQQTRCAHWQYGSNNGCVECAR